MTLDASALVGGWLLEDWRIEYGSRRAESRPFGRGAGGLLVYAPDGWMTATMWQEPRSAWTAVSARRASIASKAAGADEYLSYCGRWRLAGNVVEHHIEGALNPSLIGTCQLRQAQLLGRRLVLSADETDADSGATRRHIIEWRRAEG